MCDQHGVKYQQLLRDLKTTVEGLLVSQVANVWSIYGGLSRLHTAAERIFKHGHKGISNGGFFDFVHGLEWLQPESSKSYFSIDCEHRPHIPVHLKGNPASIWLYKSLENYSLSQKLSWLLSDNAHLLKCYQEHAFLCQEQYAEATLICLRAVERNQATLLTEIDPCLFLSQTNAKEFHKLHRRCSSYPDSPFATKPAEPPARRSQTMQNITEISPPDSKPRQVIQGKLKPWSSLPNLRTCDTSRLLLRSGSFKTTPNTPVHRKGAVKKLNKRPKKKEVRRVILHNPDIEVHRPLWPPLEGTARKVCSVRSDGAIRDDYRISSLPKEAPPVAESVSSSPRLVDNFLPLSGKKDFRRKPRKSFIEDGGGMSVQPMATGYFPRPTKGQSLLSFLSSGQFARANAELDRENAHFSISEAIITALEHFQCRKNAKLADPGDRVDPATTTTMDDSDDPEISELRQRIRLRRRRKVFERHKRAWSEAHRGGMTSSGGKTDTTTTVSPGSSSTTETLTDNDTLSEDRNNKSGEEEEEEEEQSDDDVDDLELAESTNLPDARGVSVSMASLYSEADLARGPALIEVRGTPDGAPSDVCSAEGVALSLISKFSEKQLPRASDLKWLVSEEEVSQTLLPLPDSWPVNPDDVTNDSMMMSLRGTQEWAPPRPQIIFTFHPSISRKDQMQKQNYRCAGCSMKVPPQYASKFRYCDYLGRYFCTGCHSNQLALIPGRILQKWDFSRYPVSSFSYKLLEQMYADPLFRVFELNKNIAKLSKNLEICTRFRRGLRFLKDYVYACRFAEDDIKMVLDEFLEKEKQYILDEPEVYSIEDLVNVKNGTMKNRLRVPVDLCLKHTAECKLCLARGFVCEICRKDEVIFPWQVRRVHRCGRCGDCFHNTCWKPEKQQPCPKCNRMKIRRRQKQNDSPDDSNDRGGNQDDSSSTVT